MTMGPESQAEINHRAERENARMTRRQARAKERVESGEQSVSKDEEFLFVKMMAKGGVKPLKKES